MPVFTHTSSVSPDDLRTLAGDLDPTAPGTGHHLNFDQILRRCGQAWMAFLTELGFGAEIICPRVEVDYHREVGTGLLEVDVSVLTLGRTSFRLRLAVRQSGEVAATVQAVLVGFDYTSRTTLPLTAAHRAALNDHLVDS